MPITSAISAAWRSSDCEILPCFRSGPDVVSIHCATRYLHLLYSELRIDPPHVQTDTQSSIRHFEEIPCQIAKPSTEPKKTPARASPRLPSQETLFAKRSIMCERESMARVRISKPSRSVFPKPVEPG